ncbi:hypothetical protein BGZ54_008181 [Gamsiella multidivaricata]|nr:hypothetical protein BGZ54_008181 [Gamsiella multidivaricata]
MTSCFVSSNGRSTAGASTASGASVFTTEASATGEGGGDDDIEAHTKRSAPPNNTLSPSMGAGASMLRPRPRLSQQRSADELSKASASETLDPSYDKGHHSRQHTSGGDVALNSTPTTIVQSISTEGVGNSSGGSNGRSGSACKATSRLQQRDFARTSQRRVTGASASDAIAATLVLLPSHFPESDIQLSPSLGYAPMMDGVAEETTEIRLNSFSPTAATSSKLAETTEMSVFAPGEEVSLMAAGNGGNKAAGSAEDTANRSSFHSLHSNNNNNNGRSSARRLSLMELGRSLGVHAAANDYGRTTKGEVTPPHLQPLDPGATMMMMMDGVDAQTQERVVEETVLVEDKAGGRGVSGSGSGSSSSSSHPGKKHQTVLGASKAVVSGVFGKFRKNIG